MHFVFQDERLEILHVLTRKVNLSANVDLVHLAQTCDNFTGADFKALLYNAQLEAIHELTDSVGGNNRGNSCSSDSSQDFSNRFEMLEEDIQEENLLPPDVTKGRSLSPDGSSGDQSFSKLSTDGSVMSDEDHKDEHEEARAVVTEKARKPADTVAVIANLEEGLVDLQPAAHDKLMQQVNL